MFCLRYRVSCDESNIRVSQVHPNIPPGHYFRSHSRPSHRRLGPAFQYNRNAQLHTFEKYIKKNDRSLHHRRPRLERKLVPEQIWRPRTFIKNSHHILGPRPAVTWMLGCNFPSSQIYPRPQPVIAGRAAWTHLRAPGWCRVTRTPDFTNHTSATCFFVFPNRRKVFLMIENAFKSRYWQLRSTCDRFGCRFCQTFGFKTPFGSDFFLPVGGPQTEG